MSKWEYPSNAKTKKNATADDRAQARAARKAFRKQQKASQHMEKMKK